MKKIASAGAALLVGAALAGCATPGGPGRTVNCSGPTCRVDVTMTDCDNHDVPDKVIIKRPKEAPSTIHWHVSGGRLARDNGIYIKRGGDPGQQVTGLNEAPAERAWRMDQKGTPGTTIGYGVNLIDTRNNNKACAPIDPYVINEP